MGPSAGDALLVVDVQNDFLPGGSLGVRGGDAVIAPLNRALRLFGERGLPIVATRDWHPPRHCSFKERGGPWPEHCVQQTAGARFAAALELPENVELASKGADCARDAYSAFQGTGLGPRLEALGARRVFVGGLAADYCVRHTVRDALAAGLEAVVLSDAVRAVDARPGDGERALRELERRGARILESAEALRLPLVRAR